MGQSTFAADPQDIPRPVVTLAIDYPSGFFEPAHAHRRAQLLYATKGVMYATTEGASWILPPSRALWLPAFTAHAIRCRGAVSLRTLYIEEGQATAALATQPRVIEVSRLLSALILEAVALPPEYDEQGRDGRIMALAVDEIARMPALPLSLPMPADARLRRICVDLLENPPSRLGLDDWARKAAMSRRSLTRRFRQETGLGFAAWRQQLRLLEGLARITTGQSVTGAALDAGYQSPSAFTAVFSKVFGAPPSKFSQAAVPDIAAQ